MKKFIYAFLTTLFTIFILSACRNSQFSKKDPPKGVLLKKKITIDDIQREYEIYLPENLGNSPEALVFELHGGGVYVKDLTAESGYKTPYKLWMNLADKENFIVVYPQGLNGSYLKPSWNDCRKNAQINSNANDVLFISKLIDKITRKYEIDSKRVFISGTSNGALMALRLAIEIPDKIKAVAATAGSMADVSKCKDPKKPISVMFINSTKDNRLPYNGGLLSNPPNQKHGSVYSVEKSVRIWRNLNKSAEKPTIRRFIDLDPSDESTVIAYKYSNSENGTEVVLYKIEGGGHLAPSIKERYSAFYEKLMGKQNHDIEMTTEVWNFFKKLEH